LRGGARRAEGCIKAIVRRLAELHTTPFVPLLKEEGREEKRNLKFFYAK